MGGMIFSVIMLAFAFMLKSLTAETGDTLDAALFYLLIFSSIMLFITSYRSRKKKRTIKAAQKQEKIEKGYTFKATFKLMTGLPFSEGSIFDVCLYEDKYAFERNNSVFNLPFEKIIDVAVTTSTEIQKSHASSVGGAVGGAVMFGALGAMVGGRAKEKTSSIEYKYLVFTYEKDGSTEYISFDVTAPKDSQQALKFVAPFTSKEKSKKEFQL